jgi:phosphatidylglycerol:prolipoprotein diacylglycerol transferase
MNPMLWAPTLPLVGKVEFPAYMTLLIVGFAVAMWLGRREEDRRGGNGDRIVDLGLLMLVAGVLGARLMSVLFDGQLQNFVWLCTDPARVPALDALVARCTTDAQCGYDYWCNPANQTCAPPRDCLAALKFWQGGLAYYGGLLLAAPVGFWDARTKNLGVGRIADLTAPLIVLGLFFGRMGCFLNGCCYGAPTDLAWGVDFPQRDTPAGHLHPTQLYEALGSLGLYAFLAFVVRPRKRRHGEVFAWMLVSYGVLRFALEFFRADARGALGGLSTSQWISIPLVAVGVYLVVRWRRLPEATSAG